MDNAGSLTGSLHTSWMIFVLTSVTSDANEIPSEICSSNNSSTRNRRRSSSSNSSSSMNLQGRVRRVSLTSFLDELLDFLMSHSLSSSDHKSSIANTIITLVNTPRAYLKSLTKRIIEREWIQGGDISALGFDSVFTSITNLSEAEGNEIALQVPTLSILKIISWKEKRGDRVKKPGEESITNGSWQWRGITRSLKSSIFSEKCDKIGDKVGNVEGAKYARVNLYGGSYSSGQ
ncbi:hypothetical protein V1478_003598, partial [Vespula squamosa]